MFSNSTGTPLLPHWALGWKCPRKGLPIFTSNREFITGMMKIKPPCPTAVTELSFSCSKYLQLPSYGRNMLFGQHSKQRYPHFWVLGYPSSPSTLWDTSRSTSQHLMPNPTSASTAKIKPNAQHPTSVRSCSKISKTCSYSMSFLLYIKRTHYIYLLLFVAVTNA